MDPTPMNAPPMVPASGNAPTMDPTLMNVLGQASLKWIFFGGKGGVGKTTTSCSFAIQLARVRSSVLLLSTDPAHNLSDAFGQKFGKTPTLVAGYDNLFAMEIDPQASMGQGDGELLSSLKGIPGIDEAIGFSEVMKLVKSMEYSAVVFDTAPTGHTLRFLSLPGVIDKALGKLTSMGDMGGMIQQVSGMVGLDFAAGDVYSRIRETKGVVEEVHRQFMDPGLTTFVCVCIPEFLSLYETERLVQELARSNIDVHNIVVNQIVWPGSASGCRMCQSRQSMQSKYLGQIQELYDDFHVVLVPLVAGEVRGTGLETFSRFLLEPLDPASPVPDQ